MQIKGLVAKRGYTMRERVEDLGRILSKCEEVLEGPMFGFPRYEDQFYQFFLTEDACLQQERFCELRRAISLVEEQIYTISEIAEGSDYLNDDLNKMLRKPS